MESPAQSFAKELSRLFVEYAQKMATQLDEIRRGRARISAAKDGSQSWFGSRDWQVFQARFSPVQAALQTATREASQLAEQGGVDDAARIELRVRLAEVEGLMNAVQNELMIS